MVKSKFGTGDESPAELFDGGVVFGFHEGQRPFFFKVVGFAGEDFLEGFADECLRVLDFLEFVEERGIGNELVKEFPVGEGHGLLNRGGEVFSKEGGKNFRESVAKIHVVWCVVTESDANRAGESFGGKGLVEGSREERVERRIGSGGGRPGIELVGLGFGEDTDESAEVVAVVGEVTGEPGEEFGMAGGVGRVHEIDGVDEAAPEEEGPDAIDNGAGEVGIVGGDGFGEFLAPGELGNGKGREIFFELLVLLEFLEPLFGRGDAIETGRVLDAFPVGFGDDLVGVENELGLIGFPFEVGELIVATVGAFGNAGAFGGFDVEAAIEEGDESPVVALLDFGSNGVVVALGALDLFAKKGAGSARGHFLVVIALVVEEPGGAIFDLLGGAGDEEVPSNLIPGAVGFEGPAEVVEPGLSFAAVTLSGFSAVEEDDVESLGEMFGVLFGFGEAVDEGVSFVRIWVFEEGLSLFGFGNAAEEVEVDSADEGGVV